jgi:hypothetical protein
MHPRARQPDFERLLSTPVGRARHGNHRARHRDALIVDADRKGRSTIVAPQPTAMEKQCSSTRGRDARAEKSAR